MIEYSSGEILCGDIVRLEKRTSQVGIIRYTIYGMNIFVENNRQSAEPIQQYCDTPFDLVYERLFMSHHLICIIGYPAIQNYTTDIARDRDFMAKQEELSKYLGNSKLICTGIHDGDFYDGCGYGGHSLIVDAVNLKQFKYFERLFTYRDALANIVCDDVRNNYNELVVRLAGFNGKEQTLKIISGLSDLLMLSRGDRQFLQIYTKNVEKEVEIINAAILAEEAIKGNEWFRRNRKYLKWDDGVNLCYMFLNSGTVV